jgi:hypothetical protein
LAQRGAITPEGLLDLTRPPFVDRLKQQLAAKAKAEQEFLAQHPELAKRGKGRR